MRLGDAFENGGRFAHAHPGMATGAFDLGRCHGCEPAKLAASWDADPASAAELAAVAR